jgi:hypothetical protein
MPFFQEDANEGMPEAMRDRRFVELASQLKDFL